VVGGRVQGPEALKRKIESHGGWPCTRRMKSHSGKKTYRGGILPLTESRVGRGSGVTG